MAIAYVSFEIIEHVFIPLFWKILKKRKRSVSGAAGMIGEIGEVKEWNKTEGKVFVHGELWNATSEVPLSPGDKAIIQAVDRLILKVKPFNN